MQVRSLIEENELGLRNVLLDAPAEMERTVGSMALPTTLFHDARGRLVDPHIGELSRATLLQKLQRFEAVLPG